MTSVKNLLLSTQTNPRYDQQAKKVLSNKTILAVIIKQVVPEFHDVSIKKIKKQIESIEVGKRPVYPGLTNAEFIQGMNTEHGEPNERVVTFDVYFELRTRDGKSSFYINIEMMKDIPTNYRLLNRSVFYACRGISSQYHKYSGAETMYNQLRPVYSIWICFGQPTDSITRYELTKHDIIGKTKDEVPDLIHIVRINLSDKIAKEEIDMYRILKTVFGSTYTVEERMKVLTDIDSTIESGTKEEVDEMCNLSAGIYESGVAKGVEKGKLEMIKQMHSDGMPIDKISKYAEVSINKIREFLNLAKSDQMK